MGRGAKKNHKALKPPAVVDPVSPPKDKEECDDESGQSKTPTDDESGQSMTPTIPLSNVDAMVQEMFPDLCISCTLLERMCRHVMMCTLKSDQPPPVDLMSEFRYCCRELGNCCGAPRRYEPDHGDLDSTSDEQTGKFWNEEEPLGEK